MISGIQTLTESPFPLKSLTDEDGKGKTGRGNTGKGFL